MKRRDFLKGLGIGAAATAIPASALTHAEQLVKQSTVKSSTTVQSNAIKALWPGIETWYSGSYSEFEQDYKKVFKGDFELFL